MAAFPLAPGSTLGILGGGQLGRMLALAAARLGFDVAILERDADSPAGRVARIVRTVSPLIAPEITADPRVLVILNGSPVRYDSSITPRPSTTSPSTGQTS